MKTAHKHYGEKWYDNTIFTAALSVIILLILSLLVILTIQTFGKTNDVMTLSSRSVMQASEDVTLDKVDEIPIQLVSNANTDRQFEKIKTHLFEAIDTKTGKAVKISEAKLPFEYIENTLNDYLITSKYKTLAIGVVDNKLYIQQDTSVPENEQLKVKIISMMDEFTADSWFKLTEAVFNSSDVQAMSLFSYQTDNGNKHLIYIFKDK